MAQVNTTTEVVTTSKMTGVTLDLSVEEAENLFELLHGHISSSSVSVLGLSELVHGLEGVFLKNTYKFERDHSLGITCLHKRPDMPPF